MAAMGAGTGAGTDGNVNELRMRTEDFSSNQITSSSTTLSVST